MALKKYRFLTGMCGPTFLYTNIIRAKDERAAVLIYLAESGKEPTEENIAKQLQNIREIVPKATPDKLLDYLGREIALGDEVYFIRNKTNEAPKLLPGKVTKKTGKSIVITTSSGDSNRVILASSDDVRLSRVIVMGQRPERLNEGAKDASGYPIMEGDAIAYMQQTYINRCNGFESGDVTKITAKYVEIERKKRVFERVLVINWQQHPLNRED